MTSPQAGDSGKVAFIPLTQGYQAIVDPDMVEILSQNKWAAAVVHKAGYVSASRTIVVNGKKTSIGMHRFILNAPKNMIVDHINGNPLDNRRSNLRLTDRRGNSRNRRASRTKKDTKFKGICREGNSWSAQISIRLLGKTRAIHLGCFSNEIDAAKAYDRAAIELFGEFAKTNIEIGEG